MERPQWHFIRTKTWNHFILSRFLAQLLSGKVLFSSCIRISILLDCTLSKTPAEFIRMLNVHIAFGWLLAIYTKHNLFLLRFFHVITQAWFDMLNSQSAMKCWFWVVADSLKGGETCVGSNVWFVHVIDTEIFTNISRRLSKNFDLEIIVIGFIKLASFRFFFFSLSSL